MVARGMEEYLWQNQILFKDYVGHVKRVSERVKQSSLEPFKQQQLPVIFLSSPSEDKEAMARKVRSGFGRSGSAYRRFHRGQQSELLGWGEVRSDEQELEHLTFRAK